VSTANNKWSELDEINELLQLCSNSLGKAAGLIRDAKFNSRKNIRRIANAIAEIAPIQFEIHAVRNDLIPEGFNEPPNPIVQLRGELNMVIWSLEGAQRWLDGTDLNPDDTRDQLNQAARIVQTILGDLRAKHGAPEE
jgi:hypothetical protein